MLPAGVPSATVCSCWAKVTYENKYVTSSTGPTGSTKRNITQKGREHTKKTTPLVDHSFAVLRNNLGHAM